MVRNKKHFNESQAAGFDGLFDWDFIEWPGNIEPMDLDALVERKRHFIIFETKHSASCKVPKGQQISLKALYRLGRVTVVILYGKTAETIEKIVVWPEAAIKNPKGFEVPFEDAAETVQSIVNAWYSYADGVLPNLEEELREIANL